MAVDAKKKAAAWGNTAALGTSPMPPDLRGTGTGSPAVPGRDRRDRQIQINPGPGTDPLRLEFNARRFLGGECLCGPFPAMEPLALV